MLCITLIISYINLYTTCRFEYFFRKFEFCSLLNFDSLALFCALVYFRTVHRYYRVFVDIIMTFYASSSGFMNELHRFFFFFGVTIPPDHRVMTDINCIWQRLNIELAFFYILYYYYCTTRRLR